MSSVEITRKNVTRVRIEIPRFGNQWKVEHILWLAREIEKAREEVDLPADVEVKIHDSRITVDHSIIQEIP